MANEVKQWQMDCYGHHRITVGEVIGPPALYDSPAILLKDGKIYLAFSQYYEDVPTERVLEAVIVSDQLPSTNNTSICNFFNQKTVCTHRKKQVG